MSTACSCCSAPLPKGRKMFCSRDCQIVHRKEFGFGKYPRQNCEQCGLSFRPNPANIKTRPARFCSGTCYHQYRSAHPEQWKTTKRRVTVACEFCGKEFERYRSEYDSQPHHYCSRQCSGKANSKVIQHSPELATQTGRAVTCLNCSVTFYVKPHRVGKRKFCSRPCFNVFRFGKPRTPRPPQDLSGEKNPNYRHGKTLATGRKLALDAFGPACMVCSFDIVVDVHHLEPRRHGGKYELQNLIVLCPNHHRMADLGLLTVDELKTVTLAAIAKR